MCIHAICAADEIDNSDSVELPWSACKLRHGKVATDDLIDYPALQLPGFVNLGVCDHVSRQECLLGFGTTRPIMQVCFANGKSAPELLTYSGHRPYSKERELWL
jgi:hypothetical protein